MSRSHASVRVALEISELKNDPSSFLALGVEDLTLRKLESYRLRKLGYSAEQIAQTLDFSRSHLYHMWKEFERAGTPALIKKNWGAATRKLTTTLERRILRAKALNPLRSDSDLAREFDLDRTTVYRLLKEHGLQDLHHVLVGDRAQNTASNISPSCQLEIVPCRPALLLTLLPQIEATGALHALSGLGSCLPQTLYSNQQLQLSLLLMAASGVLRLSHIDDLPSSEWAIALSTNRRPCTDTLDHYLQQIIDLDEQDAEIGVVDRLGMIRPGGLIEQAQLESFRLWVEAGLTDGQIWNFDGHVIEYTGRAGLDKTKHGTKARAVKAIKRFTISNGFCVLDYYCPAHTTFADACRHLIKIANQALGPTHQIRFLAFDREGSDKALLDWLKNKADVNPITWVKRTTKTVKLLNEIPDGKFQELSDQIKVGKKKPKVAKRWADTEIEFSEWGQKRVVVLETTDGKRLGIYSSAKAPTKEHDCAKANPQECHWQQIIDQKAKVIDLDRQPPATEKCTPSTTIQTSNPDSIVSSTCGKISDNSKINQSPISRQCPPNRAKTSASVTARSDSDESDHMPKEPVSCQVASNENRESQNRSILDSCFRVGQKVATVVNRTLNKVKQQLSMPLTEEEPQSNKGVVKDQLAKDKKEANQSASQEKDPNQSASQQDSTLSASELILAMRHRQRLENQFKVEVNEMGSDAIPTHKSYQGTIRQAYDVNSARHKVDLAQARLLKYEQQRQEQNRLYEQGQINKHQLNELQKRTARLQRKTEKELNKLSKELDQIEIDSSGEASVYRKVEVLDLRKMVLLNLIKLHALVILRMLASQLGIPEAGPTRIRRSFFSFGQQVVFDHYNQIATVVAAPFTNGKMRDGYRQLCQQFNDNPAILTRQGVNYRLYFKLG